jgi:hypothetical protein
MRGQVAAAYKQKRLFACAERHACLAGPGGVSGVMSWLESAGQLIMRLARQGDTDAQRQRLSCFSGARPAPEFFLLFGIRDEFRQRGSSLPWNPPRYRTKAREVPFIQRTSGLEH